MAQPPEETVLDEAMDLLAQGKRYMALDDYVSATDHLEQSCQLFDSYYGVAKRECADAYLEYGLALVALANAEAGTDRIMKRAGIEDGDDEDGGDNDEDDDEEADNEEEEDDDNDETENDPSKDPDEKENDATIKDVPMEVNGNSTEPHTNGKTVKADNPEPSASTSSGNADDVKPGTSTGVTSDDTKDDNGSENDEATTIEIAWEVLCLAKRLFMTDESFEGRVKLAETLQKLGEISIEWDNNDNAVSILEECLNIRKAILEPEDRLIALTYYHLGLAYSFKEDTPNANDSFSKAIEVIEKRIASLEKSVEKSKQDQDTASITSYQKEINELKELLPDMTMRLDDSKEDAAKGTEAFKRTIEEQEQEDEAAKRVCLDKSKPVDDISHLVKRKTN